MFQPPLGKPWLLFGLLGCSLALNLVMVLSPGGGEVAADEPVLAEVPAEDIAASVAPGEVAPTAFASTEGAAAVAGELSAELAAAVPVDPSEPIVGAAGGWQVVDGSVRRSLAHTFRDAVGDQGDALSAVYARLFVWDLDLRRDLQPGDRVQVAWRVTEQGQVEVGAARLHSSKYGRTFTAYRWHAPEDAFPSFWAEDGTEVPHRLINSPLRDYEQITSLLKDRPSHEGMDFKTPVGTPIASPWGGQVTRVNWNWGANGNCVEVQYDSGVLAKYLHMSENSVEAGQRIEAGAMLGRTGNTGRSTAPHLHYQLEKGGKVADPIEVHGSERRALTAAAMPTFHAEVSRFDTLMDGALASR